MATIPYIATNSTVNFSIEGNPYHVPRTADTFVDLITALNEGDAATALGFVTRQHLLVSQSNGTVSFVDGVISYRGTPIHDALTERIKEFAGLGLPFDRMLKLLQNIYDNPNERAKAEIYPFIANKELPITEDGYLVAYKVVKRHADGHLYDKHSGTVRNDVGDIPTMHRENTTEWGVECGQGFHAGNAKYSGPEGSFFDRSNDVIVEVEINPKDIVSIPGDGNADKLRTCKYKVLAELKSAFTSPAYHYTPEPKPTIAPEVREKVTKAAKRRTWAEIVAMVLKNGSLELDKIYKRVARYRDETDAPNMKAKVRQVLQKIAKKNQKTKAWKLKG